jgi:hypothetical protein
LLLLFKTSGSALRAGTGPLRRVAEDRTGRRQGGDFLPLQDKFVDKVVFVDKLESKF